MESQYAQMQLVLLVYVQHLFQCVKCATASRVKHTWIEYTLAYSESLCLYKQKRDARWGEMFWFRNRERMGLTFRYREGGAWD